MSIHEVHDHLQHRLVDPGACLQAGKEGLGQQWWRCWLQGERLGPIPWAIGAGTTLPTFEVPANLKLVLPRAFTSTRVARPQNLTHCSLLCREAGSNCREGVPQGVAESVDARSAA